MIVDLAIILLGSFLFPTFLSLVVSLYQIFLYFFGNPCLMSISDVSKMYSNSSLKRQFSLPICFLVILILTIYITIYLFIYPLCMRPQRCFRYLYLSGIKNALRVVEEFGVSCRTLYTTLMHSLCHLNIGIWNTFGASYTMDI